MGKILIPFIFAFILMFSACAQKPVKLRVGVLCGLDFFSTTFDGFKSRLAELGYREGENIVYDVQRSNADSAVADKILSKFISDDVDCIFVYPTNVALSAKKATKGASIPVVFANANIEGVDLVESIKEPGDNITGVRYPGPDLTVKRFEILSELAPKAKRFWVPYKRGLAIIPSQLEALRSRAKESGISLVETPADNLAEIESIIGGFEKAGGIRIDAILMIADQLVVTPEVFEQMAVFAERHGIPIGGAIMSVNGHVSIFGVSTDNVAVGKQAAQLALKIFQGKKAGSIPVVSAENYLIFNYSAGKRFGITIPDGLLKQADEVLK